MSDVNSRQQKENFTLNKYIFYKFERKYWERFPVILALECQKNCLIQTYDMFTKIGEMLKLSKQTSKDP